MFSRKDWRLGFLLFPISFLFILVLVRLFQIQVLDHQKYAVLAERQHGISYSLPAVRGKIYSQDEFPLVSNRILYLLYAEPPQFDFSVISRDDLAKKLFDILVEDGPCPVINFEVVEGLDPFQFREACESGLIQRLSFKQQWIPLVRNVTLDQKEKIEELNFAGLGFEPVATRFYPEGVLAAHVLGFVGVTEKGEPQGYYGLEGFYNGDLSGSPGIILEERSALGDPILVGEYKKRLPGEGRDLVLTLDRAVQFMIEEKLQAGVERFGAEGGTVIVMEPSTGAILAMANKDADHLASHVEPSDSDHLTGNTDEASVESPESSPSAFFADPSALSVSSSALSVNTAIASSYEPGSVLKALTMAAGVDSGKITPQTTFYSQPLEIGSYTIRTWDNKYYGKSTMVEVLERSDNTGAAWVALEKLGKKKLRDYFLKFGLGEKTGVDLEGEASGIVKPLSEWRDIDLANASFGQGISTTPLQLVNSFSAIANEGVLMRPYLVSEMRCRDKTIPFGPQEVRRVISKHSAKVMTAMLTKAAGHGEAQFFVLKDWEVAGKTGTAQIPIGGRYDPHKTNATFIGFLPKSKKFVMLVKLDRPSTSMYAAETAVPLWMEIAEGLIAYYGIPPDK